MLLSEFRELCPQLVQFSDQIFTFISGVLKEQGIELNAIEHRVKTEKYPASLMTFLPLLESFGLRAETGSVAIVWIIHNE